MKIAAAIELVYDYISETDDEKLTKIINFLHFILENYKALHLFQLDERLNKTKENLEQSIREIQGELKTYSDKIRNIDLDLAEALEILANSDIDELLYHSRSLVIRTEKIMKLKEEKNLF